MSSRRCSCLYFFLLSIFAKSFGDVAVCTAPDNQWLDERYEHTNLVPDGNKGAIATWFDFRTGTINSDIYAQKIDSFGNVLWTANGVILSNSSNKENDPYIVSDGAGGAIIVWQDSSATTIWDVRAQRINASGTILWGSSGVLVCNANSSQEFVGVVEDGAGGAIIAWQDYRNGNWDIYAQRVNSSGTVIWTANGVALCTATGNQWSIDITTDGTGGAIVTWYDNRSGIFDIYAQRVNAGGSVVWTADGVAICTAANNQYSPKITTDGLGGAIITWEDFRSGSNFDIYAQGINATGSVVWTANGVGVCTNTSAQASPAIANDDNNGAIIIWGDFRNGNIDIYAQRLNSSGTALWLANGIGIVTQTAQQYNRLISEDGQGGALICWNDDRNGTDDVFAQRVDGNGNILWSSAGVLINDPTALDDQDWANAISDGRRGGAFLVWEDYRNFSTTYVDIYANRVDSFGIVGIKEKTDISGEMSDERLRVVPNPFVSYTTIPGQEREGFALYDISGRQVGIYRGDRIGEGLPAGVYFAKPANKNDKPVRIVKVR